MGISSKFVREELSDGSFIDRAIDYIVSDQWRPHGVSYRFAWVQTGRCRVLFDNHHGKVDHFHVDGIEREYTFFSIEKTLEDFLLEIKKAGGPV